MNEFRNRSVEAPHDPMMEIHAILGRMQAEGAMDEEGPFVAGLLRKVEQKLITPAEALKHLHAKMASRNDYH
jgi:hypothetical protein